MKNVLKEIRKFNKERNWDQFHSVDNLAKSIAIESGELLECMQWNNAYDKQKVCEELADVMNYCLQLADVLEVDIEEIMLDKIEKNKKKYPIDKAYGSSKKYTEF